MRSLIEYLCLGIMGGRAWSKIRIIARARECLQKYTHAAALEHTPTSVSAILNLQSLEK